MPEKIPFSCTRLHNVFLCILCVYEAAAFGYRIFVFHFIFNFLRERHHIMLVSWQLFLLCFSVTCIYIHMSYVLSVLRIYYYYHEFSLHLHIHGRLRYTFTYTCNVREKHLQMSNDMRALGYTMTNLMLCVICSPAYEVGGISYIVFIYQNSVSTTNNINILSFCHGEPHS